MRLEILFLLRYNIRSNPLGPKLESVFIDTVYGIKKGYLDEVN